MRGDEETQNREMRRASSVLPDAEVLCNTCTGLVKSSLVQLSFKSLQVLVYFKAF